MTPKVLLVANDVVPGLGVPVSGAGVRVHGLWRGLVEHGIDAEIVAPLQSLTRAQGDGTPAPRPTTIRVLDRADIPGYIADNTPCWVVITNSNQVDRLPDHPDIRLAVDFFAPKSLEGLYSESFDASVRDVHELRERKLRALSRADLVICNGPRKMPYYLGWALAAGRDPRELPLVMSFTAVDPIDDLPPANERPRILIAGFRQNWSLPGSVLEGADRLVEEGRVDATLIVPDHWAAEQVPDTRMGRAFLAMSRSARATRLAPMPFEEFREAIAAADLNVDAFTWNLERQYATVTRTVVALGSGVAAVHPDFTEISPFIEDYEAGWLYDDTAGSPITAILSQAADDMDEVLRRRRNALELARDVFSPEPATADLAAALREAG